MEIQKLPPAPYRAILISGVLLIALILYSIRTSKDSFSMRSSFLSSTISFHFSAETPEIEEVEEPSVSLCQIHVQYLGSEYPDDRSVLSVLSQLKMFDFKIGQPVWGPAETLLYLCEHQLKSGVKQTKLDQELYKIVKTFALPSTRVSWTCA